MNELSVTEAANYLGVSRQHVLRLIGEGKLSARKIGNTWIIDRVSVEAYDKARKK